MFYRIAATIVKIGLASLLLGVVLSTLNVTAEQVLADIGLTPERILTWLQQGASWAIPHIVLGAMVVLPVWIIIYLFRPPRGE